MSVVRFEKKQGRIGSGADLAPQTPAERMSAAFDGEVDAAQLAAVVAETGGGTDGRRRWDDYALIGDVLRSEALAEDDAMCRRGDFASRFAAKLADERAHNVTVLRRPRRWIGGGLAVAASVGALAWYLGPRFNENAGGEWVRAATDTGAPAVVQTADGGIERASAVIRDPRLDDYLRAHRQYAARQVAPLILVGASGQDD